MNHQLIEPALPADHPQLVTIWEASVRATHYFLTEADIQYLKPLMQQQYLKAVMLYCVKQDGNIAGFIGVLENKVEMLFIHPLYRGQGLGKKLMQFGINQLGITRVDVNEQNNQAVDFYKYLGFKVVGRQVVDGLGKPYPILNMQL